MSDRDSNGIAHLYFLGVILLIVSVYLLRVDRLVVVSALVTLLSVVALLASLYLAVAG